MWEADSLTPWPDISRDSFATKKYLLKETTHLGCVSPEEGSSKVLVLAADCEGPAVTAVTIKLCGDFEVVTSHL